MSDRVPTHVLHAPRCMHVCALFVDLLRGCVVRAERSLACVNAQLNLQLDSEHFIQQNTARQQHEKDARPVANASIVD